MTSDARAAAVGWEPQFPGRRGAGNIADPIVEPDWAGLRVVAAIEHGQAEVYRYGDRIEVPPLLEEAIGRSFEAEDGVVEGHLTTQAFETGVGAYPTQEHVPNPLFSMPSFLKRNANDPYVIGRQHRAEEEVRAATVLNALGEGVEHAFVAVDILWLDGQPLYGVPLLERKRQLDAVLVPSRLVRVTPFVRPGGSRVTRTWGMLGFDHVSWRAANSRYTPGEENPDWAVARAPRAADRSPAPDAPGPAR